MSRDGSLTLIAAAVVYIAWCAAWIVGPVLQ